jgi:surface protein
MAIFSFINRSSGSSYFVIETVTTGGFYDENSLNGTLGAYYNFTGSNQYSLVSSNHIAGYVVPPGSSSFEFNPTEYIQTGSVWFRGTGDLTVQIVGEVTSSVYGPDQISNKRILNTLPIENVFQATWDTTRTTTGSSTSTQIALPLMTTASGSLYNFVINWGDNTSGSISSSLQTETTHSYAVTGTYTTKMWGTMRGWRFPANMGDRNKIQSVDKWGGLQFLPNPDENCNAFYGCNSASFSNVIGLPDLRYTTSIRSFFFQCTNLTTVNNLDKWDISNIRNLRTTFFNCIKFDQNVGTWDVSNVTDMQGLFQISVTSQSVPNNGVFTNGGSPSIGNWNTSKVTTMQQMFTNQGRFNHNIGSWDVSNVTNFNSMFGMYFVSGLFPWRIMSGSFNNGGSPSIGNWNTSKATGMNSMFLNQLSFNQNIGSWDVGNVTDMGFMFTVFNPTPEFTSSLFSFNNGGSDSIKNWNTSKVTGLSNAFTYAGNFNQPIGNWDTSKVTSMNSIFRYADTFNQDLGNWNVSSGSNFTDFMTNKPTGSFSVANYDSLLIGWASRPVISARSINFGPAKYSAAASASRAILTGAPNNWTIVDGGQI